MACGTTKPVVLTDPTIVYQDKLVPVQVPPNLLVPCQITPLPQSGDRITWFEIFELMQQKATEQGICNERFGIIEDWMDTEL